MKTNQQTVMYDSPEAAERKTLTGWVSRTGQFWGEDEHMARWCGCTHLKCKECGEPHERNSYCHPCRDKKQAEKFAAMEVKELDGETPLCLFDDDQYFFDWDSVVDYAEDTNCSPADLSLVICRPVYGRTLEPSEFLCDELPNEEPEAHVPQAVIDAAEVFNKAVREAGALSWLAGKYRADVSKFIAEEKASNA